MTVTLQTQLTTGFAIILQVVNALPEESGKQKATLAVQNLEFEARQDHQADESQVRRWFACLAEISTDVWEVAVQTLASPITGISLVVQKIAQRAKMKKLSRVNLPSKKGIFPLGQPGNFRYFFSYRSTLD